MFVDSEWRCSLQEMEQDYFSAMAGSMQARIRASLHALRHSEIQCDTIVCLSMLRLLFALQPQWVPSTLVPSSFFLLIGERCGTTGEGTDSGRRRSGQLLLLWISRPGQGTLHALRRGMLPLLVEEDEACASL